MDVATEALLEQKEQHIKQVAEQLYEKYRDQMDLLEDSTLGKVRSIGASDVYNLGVQLAMWERYKRMCENSGSISNLGMIPNVALDVISVSYGNSIMPVLASVQPIQERQGIVWFKNVKFGDTRGAHTSGDLLADPREAITTPRNYASNLVQDETLVASTASGTTEYDDNTVALTPVLPGSVRVDTSVSPSGSVWAKDNDNGDGTGDIIGKGISGTITYATGSFDLEFATDPGDGENITVTYQQDHEGATNVPLVEQFWDHKAIVARLYALRGHFGLIQQFEMQNRFGIDAEEELARDLVSSMNTEIGGDMIKRLNQATVDNGDTPVSFDKSQQSGVSLEAHYQSFWVRLNEVEAQIVSKAGRGSVTTLVADRLAASVIASQRGFTKLTDGNQMGAHVYGTWNGMTVVRVNDPNILAANRILALYKGPSPWEGPGVWSPYMPLVVTDTLQTESNPLQNTRAAAVFGGVDVTVPNFIHPMTITES